MRLQDKPWDKNLQFALVFTLAFNLLPQITVLPFWLTGFALCCIVWKILYLSSGFPLPKRWILTGAALLGTAGVYTEYLTLAQKDASGALLVVMASLKMLETNRYRDAMLVIFICYFLMMSHLLDSQSLASAGFMVIDVFLLTGLMFQVHRRQMTSQLTATLTGFGKSYGPALKLLAITTPLWIFLFVFFPRFSTSLWSYKGAQARTGFSDDLSPGSINQLLESGETAFRVRFSRDQVFAPDSLYWRGAILTQGNGLIWSRNAELREPDIFEPISANTVRTDYDVWLEPGLTNLLFGLETPLLFSSSEPGLLQTVKRLPGFVFQTARTPTSLLYYRMQSISAPPHLDLSPEQLRAYLETPPQLDAKIIQLADTIRQKLGVQNSKSGTLNERAVALGVMKWFADNGFRYSKSPGPMPGSSGSEQLKSFLFDRKVGFCEHYAASFATLMRLLKIPSRIVIGFQGGLRNEFGDFFSIHRNDAHAWTEIWVRDPLPGFVNRGSWVRADPTSVIAPLRLKLGADFERAEATSAASTDSRDLPGRFHHGLSSALLLASAFWDELQMQWNSFLISYDLSYQLKLLTQLGIRKGTPYILAVLILGGAGIFAWMMIWMLRRRDTRTDLTLKAWQQFCQSKLLEKHGLTRKPNEGPLNFAARAGAQLPLLADEINQVTRQYISLRYGLMDAKSKQRSLREFRSAARKFARSG